MNRSFSFLALGDSYTIGEGVPLFDNFPYQTVQLLRKSGLAFHAPEIIAKTGWTTGDLSEHLDHILLNAQYDIATLLIGVNNQYRALQPSTYALEFEQLLLRAIDLTDKPRSTFVLSIPDWGLTPFARGRDSAKVSENISLFNNINRTISKKHDAPYIDITSNSPENFNELSNLCGDGLHPSRKGYARWAKLIADEIFKIIDT